MTKMFGDTDRYGTAPNSVLVEAVHNAVRDLVRQRFAASGDDWSSFVFGSADRLIGAADIAAIEQRILATGYRFAWSSMLSLRDRPEIYRGDAPVDTDASFSFDHPEAAVAQADADGRALHGVGDNVVRHPSNTTGIAAYIRTSERVVSLMRSGVPADLI